MAWGDMPRHHVSADQVSGPGTIARILRAEPVAQPFISPASTRASKSPRAEKPQPSLRGWNANDLVRERRTLTEVGLAFLSVPFVAKATAAWAQEKLAGAGEVIVLIMVALSRKCDGISLSRS